MTVKASTDSVFFYNIHKYPNYVQTVMLTNASLKPLRLRITPPKVNSFRVDFYNLPVVAPGMSLPLEIRLACTGADTQLADEIVVRTQDDKFSIMLKATSVFSRIEAHDIDFGVIPTGFPVDYVLVIKNSGNDVARYEVKCYVLQGEANTDGRAGENSLTVVPAQGEIAPFSETKVVVRITPSKTSTVLALLEINELQHKLTATIAEPKIVLTQHGKPVTAAQFSALFYYYHSYEFELCNVSPFQVNFDSNVKITQIRCQTEAENDQKLLQMMFKQIKITPPKGILKPHSANQIKISFAPYYRLEKTEQINSFMQHCGFSDWRRILNGLDYDAVLYADDETLKRYGSEYAMFRPGIDDLTCNAEIEFYAIFRSQKQENQVLLLYCYARRPLFIFSQNTFSFARGETRHLEVKSMNHYACAVYFELPCGFKINSEPVVMFQPKEQRIFEICYAPNSLSDFNGYLHIHCGNAYFNVNLPLSVNGDAYRVRKLYATQAAVDSGLVVPQDEATGYLEAPRVVKSALSSTFCADKSYNLRKRELIYTRNYAKEHLDDSDASDDGIAPPGGEIDAYNDYLDLGMQDTMYLPNNYDYRVNTRIKDKTQQYINANIDICDYASQPKRRPALNNDTTPTNKTYTQNQFDQVYFNKIADECNNKLLSKQFSIITTGAHEFDFGAVTVGTVATRYFKIANDLQCYIKIELSRKAREDEKVVCQYQLLANPQYLPPGCYTSFGIKANFLDIQENFYDTIEVLINSQLFTTLSIQAHIRRPQLRANFTMVTLPYAQEIIARVNRAVSAPKYDVDYTRDCVFFALSAENAFHRHICQNLTLCNTGTSDAVAYLYLQSQSTDLALEHTEIAVPYGVTVECKIEWIPQAEELSSNILEVSFLKGAPYYIPIVCKLNPGVLTIAEKQIELGLVNVGQQISTTLNLYNKNAYYPLFYEIMVDYFNATYASLRLYIDAAKGEISHEETLPVQLLFTAQTLGAFSIPLCLRVIGGAQYYISIKGSVETAYIQIERFSPESLMQSVKLVTSQPSSKEQSKAQSRLGGTNSIILPEAEIGVNNVVANLAYYQKIVLSNKGKVAVGMFIDATFAQYVTLQETQDNNVLFKYCTRQEMIELFRAFTGAAGNASSGLGIVGDKATVYTSAEDLGNEDKLSAIAAKYNLSIFKNAINDDYQLFTNHLMNNVNLNEIYGSQIFKQCQDAYLQNVLGKVLYVHIPVGCSCVVTCLINISQIVRNFQQKLYFWVFGQQYGNMADYYLFTYNNALTFSITSQQAVITVSSSNIDFGIKVSDKSFKQSISTTPLGNKQLYNDILALIPGKTESREMTLKQLPYLACLANSGLFSADTTLVNTTASPVRFCIIPYFDNETMREDTVFTLNQPFGIIKPFDTTYIRLFFSPSDVGAYSASLFVYYSEEAGNEFFVNYNFLDAHVIKIQLTGVAVHRNLVFDNQIYFFPNTAVNYPSRIFLNVYNVGYKYNTRLQVYFPPELSKIAFNIIWPFGNVVNHMVRQLPVVISFISTFPISFNSRIAILDENNVPYYINIAGNSFGDDFYLIDYKYHRFLHQHEDTQLKTITYFTSNQNMDPADYYQMGYTKSYILALQSISAKPLIEFSEYAVAMGFDSLYKLNAQEQLYTDFILVNPCQQIVNDKQTQQNLPLLKSFVCGPFLSKRNQSYSQRLSRIQFYFVGYFKRGAASELPFTPFLPYLTDIFDVSTDSRLQILLVTLYLFYGLRINPFPAYFTQIANRQQAFLAYAAGYYQKQVNFTQKQALNIPIMDDYRLKFLVSAYESLVNALKISGAMLNNIHFSLLLNANDFLAYCKQNLATLATNAFTTDKNREAYLVNAIISYESSQLFTDLLYLIHEYCHGVAWFYLLQEMVKVLVLSVNRSVLPYTEERFKYWILGECSEFELKRGVDQMPIKREDFVGFFSTYGQTQKRTYKYEPYLEFVYFFAGFQLYKTERVLTLPAYDNLFSGIEIALCILSFYPENTILAYKVKEFFQQVDKVSDARLQRNISDFEIRDLYCLRQRPPELPEKLWTQFDAARRELWREITLFAKKNFGYMVNYEMFYSSQSSDRDFLCHIFCIKLLTSVLYAVLPSMIPSKSLKINAFIGEPLNQAIEVANNYKQPLRYDVSLYYPLEGQRSCELSTSVSSLSIEPKTSSSFEIRITPRFLKSQIFMVRLLPSLSQLRQLQLPSFIFVNVSILDRGETQAYEMEAQAGQTQRIQIPVENISSLDVRFKITIEEKFYPIDVTKYVNMANAKEGKSPLAIKADKILQLRPNGKGALNVYFVPSHPGLYMAKIQLADDSVGVRTFDIKGFSLLPDAASVLKMTCQVNDLRYFVVKAEELNLLDKLNSTDMLRFAVVPIGNAHKMACSYKKEAFQINFVNKTKVTPDCYLYKLIILTDSATKVYELVINVLSKVQYQRISVSCEAGSETVYNVDINNLESQPRKYQVLCKSPKREYFWVNGNQQPQQIVDVPASYRTNVAVVFRPKWITECELSVQIIDIELGTMVSDILIEAKALEPKEAGTIELQAQILVKVSQFIKFKNATEAPLYLTPKFSAFPEIFSAVKDRYDVLPGETCQISIQAYHYVSGSYQSKFYLNLSDGTYYHYLVKFAVTPRDAEGSLRASTKAGTSAAVIAHLTNPLEAASLFFVSVQNIPEHVLKYEKSVRVNGKATQDFELTFQPHAAMKCSGVVKFSSEYCGEFWYRLELESSDADAEVLELKALVGYGVDAEIAIRNDTFQGQLSYTVSSSNMDAFQCSNTRFQLNYTQQFELLVHFKPQKINETEETLIYIIGRENKGATVYQKALRIKGYGILYQEKYVITISAQLNYGVSGHIIFKNPFLSRASVKFNYENSEELQFTCKDQLLEPQQEIVVNYIFIPKQLQTMYNIFTILINPTWDIADAEFLPFLYVLNCIGEYTHKQPLAFLTTPARTFMTKTVALPYEIVLDDLESLNLSFEYNHPAENPFDDIQSLINSTLSAEFSYAYSQSYNTPISQPLPHIGKRYVTFSFRPLKPFTADCMFVIQMQAGGYYKLPIYLFADQPKPEAQIMVELPNGHEPGFYQLQCYNIKNVFSEYRAYFTPNSSYRFSVSPQTGILEPGDSGIQTVHSGKLTTLLIKCDNGNSIARGELVVETKDVMFIWQVTSGFKKYVPPTGVAKITDQ